MTSAGNQLANLAATVRIRLRQGGRMLRWYTGYAAQLLSRAPEPFRPPPWPLPARPEPAEEVARIALPRPAIFGDIVPARFGDLPDEMPVRRPTVSVASDVMLFGRHLFTTRRGEVLPEALDTEQPTWLAQGWDTRPPRRSEWQREAGEVFVVDCGFHHYGHVLLEAFPQLLLLELAPPGIEIATSVPPWPWFMTLVEGLGIDRTRVRQFAQPLPARRAWLPRPLVSVETTCHPLVVEGFQRLRDLGRRTGIAAPERLFVSRGDSAPLRRLVNQAEIEALFASCGFTIFYPELHPMEVQIAMMSGARLIAGLGGSAMHSMLFADPEARVLFVSSSAWFMAVDTLLNQGIRDLAYVFGSPLDDRLNGLWAPWRVDPSAVAAAITGHFGL